MMVDKGFVSEQRFRTLYETMAQGVVYHNPDGQIIAANPAAERILGLSWDQMQGHTPMDPRWRSIHEDGSEFTGETHPSMVALRTGAPVTDAVMGIFNPARQEYRWIKINAVPLFHPGEQRPYQVYTTFEDITLQKRRGRELEAIAQVSFALRSTTTRAELLPIILNQASDLLEAGGAALASCDPNTLETHLEAAIGDWASLAGVRQPPGEGLTCQVVDTRLPYRNSDISTESRATPLRGTGSLRAVAGVPLIIQERVSGVLWVARDHPVTDEEMRILSAIGDIAASALHRSSLFEDAQREAERMAAINATGRALAETLALPDIYRILALAIHDLLPDIATILVSIFDQHQKLITCAYGLDEGEPVDVGELPPIPLMPPGEGTQSEVIHTRRPVIIEDLHEKIKTPTIMGTSEKVTQSAMYVPMLAKGKVLGVMQVQSYTPNRFRKADAELLGLVGNTAAVAIQNARLLAETRLRLHHLTALRAIDQAITSSMDVRVTLNILLDQVISQMQVNAASVLLVNRRDHTLEYAAARGFLSNAIMHTRLRLGEGLAGSAAHDRRIVYNSDLEANDTAFTRAALLSAEGFVSYQGVPLVSKGRVLGVLELFHREKIVPDQESYNFLEALAGQAAIAIENASLLESLQRSNLELSLAYDATIEGWSRAMDMRDEETEGHTQRVAELTSHLAGEMGFSDAELVHVRRGALLHDIGKMAVPDSILLKPGPLSEDEWEIMRKHPVLAYEMLSPIPFLRPALDIPYCHHEHWDGGGYPRGLRAEQIPLAARVFAVLDVWDALLSERPYRPAWPKEKVLEYIRDNAGKLFDPQVVEAFFRTMERDSP